MSTLIIIIIVISICICSCSLSSILSVVGGYYQTQSSLDATVKNDPTILSVVPVYGLCPTDWRKSVYTNGARCIKPQNFAIVDEQNNYITTRQGTCTRGKIESTIIAMKADPNKKYFCESL